MDEKTARYTLRIDRVLLHKFRYLADAQGRSANRELELYIKKCVANFEAENGKIPLPVEETL